MKKKENGSKQRKQEENAGTGQMKTHQLTLKKKKGKRKRNKGRKEENKRC